MTLAKILKESYIRKIFEQRKGIYFPSFKNKKISKIEIEKTSPAWAQRTCLVRYKIFFSDDSFKIIRGTAKVNGSKKWSYKIMKFLYENGFGKGKFQVPKPLDYIDEIGLFIYEDEPGLPFSLILETGDLSQINNGLKNIALWLRKLHSFKNQNFKKAVFPKKAGYLKVFEKIKKFLPKLKNDLNSLPELSFIDQDWKENKYLIHNDFYPSNIVISKNKIYGIDFDRAGQGPYLMDLASIYASLEFPKKVWPLNLSEVQIKKLQDTFLKKYCQLNSLDVKKTKKELNKFLIKVFLDRIYFSALFLFDGWNEMDQKTKIHIVSQMKTLFLKIKKIS